MGKKVISFLVALAIVSVFIGFSNGAEVELKKLKIGSTIFNQYSYNLMEKGADYNAFEITRAYLSFSTNLAEKISFKAVTDIRRYKLSDPQNLQVFLKNMDLTIKDLVFGSNLSIGLINIPWVPFVEGIWKHRFVSGVFADTEGKLTSTDLAIQLSGGLVDRKYLEYYLVFANGEGYNAPEANKAKDAYVRVTLTPMPDSFKGLRLSTHYRAGLTNINQKKDVANIMLSLEQDDYSIATEYLYAVEQSGQGKGYAVGAGYSIFGFYKLGAGFTLLGRYDWFDQDANPDKQEDSHFKVIAGIGYDITDSIKVTLDNQQTKYEDKAGKANENTIYTHMLISF